jgi:hypothetical protein
MSLSSVIVTASSRARQLSISGFARVCLPFLVLLCWGSAGAQSNYTVTAPPGDGSSTGLRFPNGTKEHAYHRTATIVDGINLKLLPKGTEITLLGFNLVSGAGSKVPGKLSVYASNIFVPVADYNMVWSDIIATMTKVYDGPFTVPDTAGPVDLVLSTPFTYTGRSMTVAYDFQSAGPFTVKNAVVSSNVVAHDLTRTGFSSTQPVDVLTDVSDFRPIIRFRFPFPVVQWGTLTSGIQNDLRGLDIVDEDTAWACSPAGSAYRTSDRGVTWSDGGSVPDSIIATVGLTNALAVTIAGRESDTSAIYTTSDGGGKWSRIESPALTTRIAVAGKTSSTALWCLGTGIGDTIRALTSFDRGHSWSQSTTGLVLEPGSRISRGSAFRIGNVMWFGTSGSGSASGRVYKSSSGPSGPWRYSWTGRANVGAIAFSSGSGTGVASHTGCTDTIRRSTDGGLTWSNLVVAGLGEVSSLQYFAGGQDAWAATSTGIWRSTDDGLTWKQSFSTGSSMPGISCLRFTPSYQNAFAVGSNGLIVKGVWMKNTTTEIADASIRPNSYWLGANYPNPFNSSTWIEYSVPWPSFVTLKLIDVLGRDVATIVSETKGTGKYKAVWNAGKNPSGVYFYRLLARPLTGGQVAEFTETHKLILLK